MARACGVTIGSPVHAQETGKSLQGRLQQCKVCNIFDQHVFAVNVAIVRRNLRNALNRPFKRSKTSTYKPDNENSLPHCRLDHLKAAHYRNPKRVAWVPRNLKSSCAATFLTFTEPSLEKEQTEEEIKNAKGKELVL